MEPFLDPYFKTSYLNSADTLVVEWPSVSEDNKVAVKASLNAFINYLHNHPIKRLLIDGSKSVVTIGVEEYSNLVLDFSMELTATPLERIARVQSPDPAREKIVNHDTVPIYSSYYSIKFQEFQSQKEALCWLILPYQNN